MRKINIKFYTGFGLVIITLFCISTCQSSIGDTSFAKAETAIPNDNLQIENPSVSESSFLETTNIKIAR